MTHVEEGVVVAAKSVRASACENCPYGGRTCATKGPIDADICIVGEAPGANEIAKGVPFIGLSGKLLDESMRRANFPRWTDAFYTNALRCRPPKKGTPPNRDSISSCRPRLLEEVNAHPRKVVLALGNTAARSLLGDARFTMTSGRGQIYRLHNTIIVPTWHPAAVMRDPGKYQQMVRDMTRAADILKGDYHGEGPADTKYIVCNTPELVDKAVAGLRKVPVLAADIETGGLNPRKSPILCIGFAWKPGHVVIIPAKYLDRLAPLFGSDDDERALPSPSLPPPSQGGEPLNYSSEAGQQGLAASDTVSASRPGPSFVWHNGKFDTAFLRSYGLNAVVDEDTMLMHYAIDETRGTHDLKQLAMEMLSAGDYEREVKELARGYKAEEYGYSMVPRKILYKYLAKDCDYTFQIFQKLYPRLERSPGLMGMYRNLLVRASVFLQQVEERGIWVNQDTLEALRKRLEAKRDAEEATVQEVADAYWDAEKYVDATGAKKMPKFFNPASSKQVNWLVYSKLGLRPAKGFEHDTQKETLESMPKHPFTGALLRLRSVEKELSTYVYGIQKRIEGDGRVHSTFLIHGTVTGRLSSRNPNMQNIPREGGTREVFAAPPGRILVEVDLSQAELRVLAHLSQDDFLVGCYREGRKLHHEVAVTMYGEGYNGFQYIRAKAVNFGIAYGRGGASLAQEFGIPDWEGEEMVNAWFRRAPVAHKYILWCRQQPLLGKSLVSPFGRRRRFGLVTKENLHEVQNEASNFPMQSTASDITLTAAIEMEQDLPLQVDIINLVHDSILFECPNNIDIVREVIRIAKYHMKRVPYDRFQSIVPFESDAKIGYAWGALAEWDPDKELPPEKLDPKLVAILADATF
jgi:uracil-DNA glycosylase family 4